MKALLCPVPQVLALLCIPVLLGCGATRPPLRPGPLSPEVSFEGNWESNYGPMVLRQIGQQVEGSVEHREGRIQGRAEGDLLLFDWEQPRDRTAARMAVHGKGWLRISQDGSQLEGLWGYDDSREGGGTWRAKRVPE